MSMKKKADEVVFKRGGKVMRALALEFTKRVVEKTPVDTGRARSNWNTSIGRPRFATTDVVADITKTLAEAAETFAKWEDPIKKPAFLANGLPYIKRLEDGHSKTQAPAGMVRVTKAELSTFWGRLVRRVRNG